MGFKSRQLFSFIFIFFSPSGAVNVFERHGRTEGQRVLELAYFLQKKKEEEEEE